MVKLSLPPVSKSRKKTGRSAGGVGSRKRKATKGRETKDPTQCHQGISLSQLMEHTEKCQGQGRNNHDPGIFISSEL